LGYDDNTSATRTDIENKPRHELTPGLFAQGEGHIGNITLRPGLRVDRSPVHGMQYAPRLHGLWGYKGFSFRAGTGLAYRTVNVITEDHAALTGSRRLVLANNLKAEQALSSLAEIAFDTTLGSTHVEVVATAWQTNFTNKILPDLETDPNAIIYRNTGERAQNQGITLQLSLMRGNFSGRASGTWLQYTRYPVGEKARTVLYTPSWQSQAEVTYRWLNRRLQTTLRAEAVGPMPLPLQVNDTRPATSKPYVLFQTQVSYQATQRLTVLANVRNVGNWLPKYAPLNRPADPFDTQATSQTGTFDTAYVYGPLGGRSFLVGLDYLFN
jgi:outer membrane receptor for ferrienterochelin and colicins